MGFNSGFKELIYIVHLVGYFHSWIEIQVFKAVHFLALSNAACL